MTIQIGAVLYLFDIFQFKDRLKDDTDPIKLAFSTYFWNVDENILIKAGHFYTAARNRFVF